ncbi:MAG TPA: PmoA family protein [Candidatus Hydrogenedentes bacterium]|nr:PmoA family protein [Candidatus Hydrogenedentota bacterium]
MRKLAVTFYGIIHGSLIKECAVVPEQRAELCMEGDPWLATVSTPYDPSAHSDTCKVFTHLYSPCDGLPITKGAGGFDSHQRGLHIGWRRTEVEGRNFDTWHMTDCSQRHGGWLAEPGHVAAHAFIVDWCDAGGRPFLREFRSVLCRRARYGARMFDLQSRLAAVDRPVALRGDPHHAGVQIRLANEVCRRPWGTRFVLPGNAQRRRNDVVRDALWVCCLSTIRDKRHAVLHMTHPANPGLEHLVYGIRAYGRFGAFFDADLKPGFPMRMRFRILWTEGELDRDECEALYREYTSSF